MLGFACWCHNLHIHCHRARSVYPYAGWVRGAIMRFKFDDETDRVRHLGPLMTPLLSVFGADTNLALVPVPLHETRLAERGFNQSDLLAQEIARQTGVPVKPMLVRARRTAQQANLAKAERTENVRGAFALSPEWFPAASDRLVLVDDVMTTGATMQACTDVLVRAGVRDVGMLTLARDLQPRELGAYFARHGLEVPARPGH